MKKILLLLVLITYSHLAHSQTVTIGTGSSNTLYGPIYIFSSTSPNTHSWNLAIFEQSEIIANGGIAGLITGASWYKNDSGAYLAGDASFEIFIKHTGTTSFSSGVDFNDEVIGATPVYSGTAEGLPEAIGWVSYSFSTSFDWNGTDNIMVLTRWVRQTNGTDAVNWRASTTTGAHVSHSFSSSTTMGGLYTTASRANIRLDMNTISSVQNNGTVKKEITIYPNPLSALLNFSLHSAGADIRLSIRNVTGAIIKEHQHIAGSNEGNYKVDVSGLTPGIYFLEVKTNDRVFSSRFVIME